MASASKSPYVTFVLNGWRYDYNPKKIIGQGSFGTIYLGVREKIGSSPKDIQEVVIKLIDLSPFNDNQRAYFTSVLNSEVSVLKKLSTIDHGACHKQIVCYYDSTTWNNGLEYVIIMESINGLDLIYVINDLHDAAPPKRKLTIPEYKQIVCEMIKTLLYIHKVGKIAHRDVKPENIMFVDSGPDAGTIKFIDFGLSCLLGQCQTDVIKGSVGYVAPELFIKKTNVDLEKADVWSLGLTYIIC